MTERREPMTPYLSRRIAAAFQVMTGDESQVRQELLRATERAGTWERLPPVWQRYVETLKSGRTTARTPRRSR